MGDSNLLSAYKLINSQLVLSNQKLKEEIKDKIEMINALNEEVFKYREENKTLREMVHKLVEQFKTVTTIMVSVRDQSESVFNTVYNEHARKEHEQQTRRPVAGLFYEKRRTECPPYVDEAAIAEGENEDQSMADYRSAIAEEQDEDEDDELGEEEDGEHEQEKSSTPSKSPLVKRLGRKSKNHSFDESFETIDTNHVVKAARKSQEYLQCRDSHDGRHSEDGSIPDSTDREDTSNTSKTTVPPVIVVDATTVADGKLEGQSTVCKSILEVSSFSEQVSIPSDQSTQSELNPTTDQSMRPAVSLKRMASDSMLTTLIERESNKEKSTLANDTISNAASSTPVAKNGRKKPKTSSKRFTVLSPVPVVSLKPLTKENLSQHNISFERLMRNAKKVVKYEDPDSCSDQNSIDSSDSRRPRRKAAPKVLKEQSLNVKMRRT